MPRTVAASVAAAITVGSTIMPVDVVPANAVFADEDTQKHVGDTYVVTDGPASITVPDDVHSKQTITIKGTGWKNASGGSTVIVKLFYLDKLGIHSMYNRSDGIINHPGSGQPDKTIWASKKAGADGAFELTTQLPDGLKPGQRFDIQVSTGLAPGDPQRSAMATAIPIEGKKWVDPTGGKVIKCVPSAVPATATLKADRPDNDGFLELTLKGFCHPKNGASIVALKMDDAVYHRVPGHLVYSNDTVWQIVQPDPHTGDAVVKIRVPDGSTRGKWGTTVPFPTGNHHVRVLTGSLKPGDVKRSMPARNDHHLDFTVDEYSPNTLPPLPDPKKDLVPAAMDGVKVVLADDHSKIDVWVPGTKKGDWFVPVVFESDTTPHWPWGNLFPRADENGHFTLPITKDVRIPAGNLKFVVLSQNNRVQGNLLGWAPLDLDKPINPLVKPGDKKKKDDGPDFFEKNEDALVQLVKNIGDLTTKAGTTVALMDAVFGVGDSREKAAAAEAKAKAEKQKAEQEAQAAAAARKRAEERNRQQAAARHQAQGTHTVVRVIRRTITRRVPVHKSDWVNEPKPTGTPATMVSKRSQLNGKNRGFVTSALTPSTVTLAVGNRKPGSWVYVTALVNGKPHKLGWAQLDGHRQVKLKAKLPAGEQAIALNDKKSLIGWAPLVVTKPGQSASAAAVEHAALPGSKSSTNGNKTEQKKEKQAASARPLMTLSDWGLIFVALLLTFLLGLFAWLKRKNQTV